MGQTKSTRSIRLLHLPNSDEVGVFCITQKRKDVFYTFREIPCEIGGRGFAVFHLEIGALYHVRIGAPNDCSCECLGFLRHGRCKHVYGLLALAQLDLI